MNSKRMRVLMPASGGRSYVTTAHVQGLPGGSVRLSNISGLPKSLTIDTNSDNVLGRKRSGRRGTRRMGGTS